MSNKINKIIALSVLGLTVPSYALYLDGTGHYSLRGETRTSPGMAGDRGMHQSIDQNFRLLGEARLNDKSSVFVELKLFEDERQAYLGDNVSPEDCRENRADPSKSCEGSNQNTSEPGYSPYMPRITKAYARFGFDYCLVEAGRRGRDWGLGVLLDSGEDPFETSASIFDGITCDINVHRSQTLGFSVGYDKLSETGKDIRPDPDKPNTKYGASNPKDDLDQFFMTVEYDNRKANSGAAFTRKIGLYFSNVVGQGSGGNGDATDLKFFDLYTAFYLPSFTFRNEFLFRMGKSSDPNFASMGGAEDRNGEIAKNSVDAAAIAGSFEYTISSNITSSENEKFNLGSGSRHIAFFDYAIAPGSSQGYFTNKTPGGVEVKDESLNIYARNDKAEAFAFHRNFKPALILFNGTKAIDDLRVDGAFDPGRLINANVYGLGYRYEEMNGHNFEAKFISAQMNEGIPSELKSYYEANPSLTRPAGYYGKDIGYELDLKYWVHAGRQVDIGLSAAYVWAGKAWKTKEGSSPKNESALQSYITFKL